MGGFMMRTITDDPEFDKLAKSIRTKTIQNLLLVWYNVFHDYASSPAAQRIVERAKGGETHLEFSFRNVVSCLRPDDVVEMLHISRRQAVEYVKFFKTIYKEICSAI